MPERRPRLEGKVAIVTGAGSSGEGIGNGKATAVLFAREGARVLLVDAVKERAEETLAMIQEEEGVASIFKPTSPKRRNVRTWSRLPSTGTGAWISWTTMWGSPSEGPW